MKKKVGGSSSSKMAAKRGFSFGIPQTEPAEADEYSSDSEPEDERTGDQYSPKQQDSNVTTNTHSFTSCCTPNGLPSSIDYYGFECRDPSKEDMKTCERFDRLYQLSCIPLEPQTDKDLTLTAKKVQEEKFLWKLTSAYSTDNSFRITPPTVSEENKKMYDDYCKVARYGPHPISDDDIAMHSQFDR
ncbi:PREDICTED: uncharacterized protein LOC109591031 [Amphimedon queenslandica]|uniref:Uncharacterized protein n=1 Tax=Amphimedon queenslandica TaxID=400682 RepID=A0A1X7SXA3_AMPQE|nr:PREDICTED: uncharacterized protein LOC109591031 [Amphimedon queenslandica]|eukprot:XP_019862403.1 PREDICTED: uncharacterized protein LOC109591031 [Amphimedon queenslandica]